MVVQGGGGFAPPPPPGKVAVAVTAVYGPQPGPQHALLSCPFEDVFFGGARGGGKTWALLLDWLKHQALYGAHAWGLFVRRKLDDLREAIKIAKPLFWAAGAQWFPSKKEWHFPSGAVLLMKYLDTTDEPEGYQGHSYTWIGVDEAGQYPSSVPIDALRACLRSVHGVPCVMRITGNPGGAGHNWLKARYIDPSPPMTPFVDEDEETGAVVERVFIPSRLEDNQLLVKNDPKYWQRVAAAVSGNKALLRAWRFGDWDIVAGGMFDDVFARRVHVLEPFAIPASWYVDRSFDWGSSKPFSVGWWAESDGTVAPNGIHYPRGTVFRIAELYGCQKGRPNTGVRWLAVKIAKEIRRAEARMGLKVEPGPADSAIFDASYGKSIAHQMLEEGVKWKPADKRPGSRAHGWEITRRYLRAALPPEPDDETEARAGEPKEDAALYVFSTCTHWIRTVPVLPRDDKKPDDVDTDAEDHAADETRYRLMHRRLGKPGSQAA
jgi:hypothetical protein